MGDRIAECRVDMRAIHQAADEIARAMESVDVTSGTEVWSGPAGERFRREWVGHRAVIRSALEEIKEQADAILARAQKEEVVR